MEIKFEYIGIDQLTPYDHNTRSHGKEDVAAIAKSIQRYGFSDPIGVWGDRNIIVEGHGRLMAAKKLKMTEVPVIRLDHLTDEQRREYAIAHNRTAELSTWDFEELKTELQELDFGDLDLGFDLDFGNDGTTAVDDDYEVVVPEEAKCKLGQVYKLGRHRLMCGDSTKREDVEKLCGGVKVDMLLTDPPYNVAYHGGDRSNYDSYKHGASIKNDEMDEESFIEFLHKAFSNADAVMKPGAVFYIWFADRMSYPFHYACKLTDWVVRETLIWKKQSIVMGRMDYHYRHEPCLYGWKNGSHLWASDRKQSTILEFDRPSKSKLHPTMKPIPLFDYQMQNNTKGGDIVLDLFSGSGTSLIAAEQNGRTAFCMEFDPKFADVIIDRWQTLTGQTAELESE